MTRPMYRVGSLEMTHEEMEACGMLPQQQREHTANVLCILARHQQLDTTFARALRTYTRTLGEE